MRFARLRRGLSAAVLAFSGIFTSCDTVSIASVAPAPPAYPYPLDADGWMILKPAAASKQVYVSSSTGVDTAVGDQVHPIKTIARAMKLIRNGQPDWIYLKDGDSFPEIIAGNIAGAGRGAHAVITSYGDPSLGRPKITVSNTSSLLLNGSFIAVIDIEFNPGRNPSLPGFVFSPHGGGCNFRGHDIIFEGNATLWGCNSNLDIEPNANQPALTGIFVRRNIIAFAYSGGTGFSQGLHTDGLDSPLIEENFFHQNGWTPKIALGTNAMFNHGCYNSWNFGARNSYFRWNIFSNNCSSGLQQRCGGVSHNNLFLNNGTAEDYYGLGDHLYVELNVSTCSVDCPTSIGPGSTSFYTGGGFQYDGTDGTLNDNVACNYRSTAGFSGITVARAPGAHGAVAMPPGSSVEVARNVCYNLPFDGLEYIDAEHPAVNFHDNIVALCRRKYTNVRPSPIPPATTLVGTLTFSNNIYDQDGGFWWQNTSTNLAGWNKKVHGTDLVGKVNFASPSQTIEGYIIANKMGKNYQDFVALALQQRKGHYNTALVAYSVNDYFKKGFRVVVPPTTLPVTQPATQPVVPSTPATSVIDALKHTGAAAGIRSVPEATEKLGPPTSIGWTKDGTWVAYSHLDFGTGISSFSAQLGCDNVSAGHTLQVHLDSQTGPTIATLKVVGTGYWYRYVTQTATVTGKPTGVHDVYLTFSAPGSAQGVANVHSFSFVK